MELQDEQAASQQRRGHGAGKGWFMKKGEYRHQPSTCELKTRKGKAGSKRF